METTELHRSHKHSDIDQRKAQLIRQGEFYRVGLVHAKAQVKHGAQPATLFHTAVDHASYALRTRIDHLLRPTGMTVSSLAPYALTILGFIRRRRLGKQALAVAALLAGAGWYVQHRRNQQYLQ